MTIKIIQSNDYKNKKSRIKKLPQFMDKLIRGYTKRDLIEIRDIFHDGIKDDTLRLERLSELTKKRKQSQGFASPSTPLYGKGDESKDRSYMNMLNIEKTTGGWKLVPSRRKHWSGRITLKELFTIHEHGAKIVQGDKIIQIKPRPALLLAYRRWLIRQRKGEKSKELRKALTDYIDKGNRSLMKIIEDYDNRE